MMMLNKNQKKKNCPVVLLYALNAFFGSYGLSTQVVKTVSARLVHGANQFLWSSQNTSFILEQTMPRRRPSGRKNKTRKDGKKNVCIIRALPTYNIIKRRMLEEKSHTSSLLCAAERIFQVRNDRVTQRRRRRWVHPVHSRGILYTYIYRGRRRSGAR